jgi:hypothetical protein
MLFFSILIILVLYVALISSIVFLLYSVPVSSVLPSSVGAGYVETGTGYTEGIFIVHRSNGRRWDSVVSVEPGLRSGQFGYNPGRSISFFFFVTSGFNRCK